MLTDPVNEVPSYDAIIKNRPLYRFITDPGSYPVLVHDFITQDKDAGLSYDGVHLKSFSPTGKRMVY